MQVHRACMRSRCTTYRPAHERALASTSSASRTFQLLTIISALPAKKTNFRGVITQKYKRTCKPTQTESKITFHTLSLIYNYSLCTQYKLLWLFPARRVTRVSRSSKPSSRFDHSFAFIFDLTVLVRRALVVEMGDTIE